MAKERFWMEEGLSVGAFYAGCDERLLASYRAMEVLFLDRKELVADIPLLERGLSLHCYCEAPCLDCQTLVPLLDIVCRRGATPLSLHSHRRWARQLAKSAADRTLATLPTVLVVGEEGRDPRLLFGRPGGLDVVSWRTGRGWRELFDFLRAPL